MPKVILKASETVYYTIPVEVPDDWQDSTQEYLDTLNIDYDDYIDEYDWYENLSETTIESWDEAGISKEKVV